MEVHRPCETRSSSREVRRRVYQLFSVWSILVGEPSPKKGKRALLGDLGEDDSVASEMPATCLLERGLHDYLFETQGQLHDRLNPPLTSKYVCKFATEPKSEIDKGWKGAVPTRNVCLSLSY